MQVKIRLKHRETFFFSPPQTGRGSERQLWVDDKTQKCIRFHGSVTPTSARYTSALCFKRNPRLSYAWPAKPLNCWSGVSSWIKSSVPWIKGRNALNAQILSLATGTQALWLLKCTAFKWKGLFLARVLFHSAPPHLGVSLIAVVFWMRPHSVYIYLRSQSLPPPLFKNLWKKNWAFMHVHAWRGFFFFFLTLQVFDLKSS